MTTETRSAFGEVLAKLMEKRGIPPTPGNMFGLAADVGLDPGEFMTRVAGSMSRTRHAGEGGAGRRLHVRAALAIEVAREVRMVGR